MKKIVVFILIVLTMPHSILAEEDETLKIAAIVAQTGVAVEATYSSLRAVQLVVDTINAGGGLLGKPVELLVFDNGSTPLQSTIAAKKAVEAGVLGIIGSQWSSHSLAVAKVAQENGIPMITNISTHPDVTRVGDYIFRVCYIDTFQGKALAQFARTELKAHKAAVMTDLLSDYSMGLSDAFIQLFTALGGQPPLEVEYKRDQEDFPLLISSVSAYDPDVVFLSGHSEGGTIIRQAVENGLDYVFLGGDGWDDTVFFQNGGNKLKEGYFTTHWTKEVDIPASLEFLKKYPEYDDSPALVLAYDATMLFADAVRRAGAADRKKIRDALAQTKNFNGVTGNITFDENGDPVKNVVIRKITDGRDDYFKTMTPH